MDGNHAHRPAEDEDQSVGFISDLSGDAPRLIVTFGGLGGKVEGLPVFEFFNSLSALDVKTGFMRDYSRAWYHLGVAGVGPDIDSVADRLRSLAAEADEMVVMGNSAGGYAALLFGALVGVEAHAFSPQTFLDEEQRALHGDKRWAPASARLQQFLDPRYSDLLPVLSASDAPAHIYYASNPLDVIHAERLAELPQVTLHPQEYARHDLIKSLRDSGWLGSFLNELARG